ncbi:MAG: transglutaminase domain-containing protein [Termitinemataceae bacterium]|nr:MAG: transglutaminase domain-containing protein [Termitinemataceae bacterium]
MMQTIRHKNNITHNSHTNHHKQFLFFLAVAILFFSCKPEKPQIIALDPQLGEPGTMLTIKGKYFGKEQNESFVSIGGVIPTRSSYYGWTDETISLVIPDFGDSGMLFVNCKNQRSNPVMFSTDSTIPELVQSNNSGPFISKIALDSQSIGSIITISGSGFGNRQTEGNVLFARAVEQDARVPAQAYFIQGGGTKYIAADDFLGAVKYWDDHLISVFVPDGAQSGLLKVETNGEFSNLESFNVNTSGGKKTAFNPKTYTIEYSVDVLVEDSKIPNTLYMWLPLPADNANQIKKEMLYCNTNPVMSDYKGTSLFKLENLKKNETKSIMLSYPVEVYAVSTVIDQSALKQNTSEFSKSEFIKKWIMPTTLIPSDKKEIIDATAELRSDKNPYSKAKAIYNYIISNIEIKSYASSPNSSERLLQTASNVDLTKLLTNKKASPYTAALLFCAMARSAEIPCVTVAGVLIEGGNNAVPHYWAMFWLDGIGWIPVDPTLGAGALGDEFKLHRSAFEDEMQSSQDQQTSGDFAAYYFGNLDNAHIAFSQGEVNLSQMEVKGHIVQKGGDYSLQNIWEESSEGLLAYSTNYSGITITGVFSK